MFLIRQARMEDIDGLMPLAALLNSMNLPKNKRRLKRQLELTEASFAGRRGKAEAQYIFVLEDTETSRLVGTSMLIAQHGTKGWPHLSFAVYDVEQWSQSLHRLMKHTCLRLRADEDGPTELGGLVLDPSVRGTEHGLGRQLSYVRFLYMVMHPERFKEMVMAELLPPFTGKWKNRFWEALGKHFTGLTYRQADRLSMDDKEFILSLFPQEPIYACLLPRRVQEMIGQVGPSSIPARKLLEKAGLRYLNSIDPFDAGPHFGASREGIIPLMATKAFPIAPEHPQDGKEVGLIGIDDPRGFRAVKAEYAMEGKNLLLKEDIKRVLGLEERQRAYLLPLSSDSHP